MRRAGTILVPLVYIRISCPGLITSVARLMSHAVLVRDIFLLDKTLAW